MLTCFEAVCAACLVACLAAQLIPLMLCIYLSRRIARRLARFRHQIGEVCRPLAYGPRAMQSMDDLIDELCDEAAPPRDAAPERATAGEAAPLHAKARERLAALAAGGQAKQYLGKAFTADQIDALDSADIEKLYARYEARLGAAMTKSLGTAALQLYAWAASAVLPIPVENQPALIADLRDEPFVGQALSSASCELYHRYGMFIAPLTAALTTVKHCQFGHRCPVAMTDDDDGEGGPRDGEDGR